MAEKIGETLGYEVVDLTYSKEGPDWVLRVAIDQPAGISSDDCVRFSQAFEKELDEVDPISGAYLLEVTSPGLERPLKKPEDFNRFAGEKAELKLKAAYEERKQWRGVLKGWDPEGEGSVILQVEDRTLTIPSGLISRARLSPDW
jgi:ribosome maturation factor RimP